MGWWRTKLDFWVPLISEKNDLGLYQRASLGRVAFWIVLSIAVWVWIFGTGDITASHMQMLYITATYNLLKKASWFGQVKTGDTQMQITHTAEEEEKPPRI